MLTFHASIFATLFCKIAAVLLNQNDFSCIDWINLIKTALRADVQSSVIRLCADSIPLRIVLPDCAYPDGPNRPLKRQLSWKRKVGASATVAKLKSKAAFLGNCFRAVH